MTLWTIYKVVLSPVPTEHYSPSRKLKGVHSRTINQQEWNEICASVFCGKTGGCYEEDMMGYDDWVR